MALLNTAIRLDEDELALADALAQAMAGTPDFRGVGLTRSIVLRMALARGLDVLAKQHGLSRRPQKQRRK